MSWESLFIILGYEIGYFVSDPATGNTEGGFESELIAIGFEGMKDNLLVRSEVNVVFLFFHFYVIINKSERSEHICINLI